MFTSPDYSMLLYQQPMSSADRSMTVTAALASSTSVSPIAQHALAPAASHQYQMHGQLDGQMRYMAVPSQQHQHMQHQQPSSLPKPIAPMHMDRFRQPSQSGLAPMQQYNPQQHYFHPVSASGQMSGMGLPNTMRQGSYPGIHASTGAHLPSGQQSVAQVAAAVAAAAAAHTIPIPNTGTAGRLGISVGMEHQGGIPDIKFSAMDMQSVASEQPMPDYLEDYTQSYMVGGPSILEASSASPTEQTLDLDLVSRLDELFMKYLEQICSNNITVDSEGESM
ncbi:hypothetical protein DL89DRAFT_434 [Linderina pennispora]|uniref:Uncharacterized protein n=1 Tax=Linderina pennispora TaxID=61395 RepID=A0A1Y1WJ96_9FUNG|nr:uncharacterized protein DL89DRAFT_434 [Linderina pennispora]ORX73552.1 hypothetical protein DL89DRAFT_434 [Linderina pennispora]